VNGFRCYDHRTNTYLDAADARSATAEPNAEAVPQGRQVDQHNIADGCGVLPSKVARYELSALQYPGAEKLGRLFLTLIFINIPAHFFAGFVLTKSFTCPCLVGKTGACGFWKFCKLIGAWFGYLLSSSMICCACCVFILIFLVGGSAAGEDGEGSCEVVGFSIVYTSWSDFFEKSWLGVLMVSEVKWFVMMILKKFNPFLTLTICGQTIIGT
jgi:hypothetical protein